MKIEDKIFISALIFFMIAVCIITYMGLTGQYPKEEERYFDKHVPEIEYSIFYNNVSKNYYLKIGYIRYENGKPVEGANASIQINNTIFYSITDRNGYANFTISSTLISIDELNGKHKITFTKEGYEDLELNLLVEYTPK